MPLIIQQRQIKPLLYVPEQIPLHLPLEPRRAAAAAATGRPCRPRERLDEVGSHATQHRLEHLRQHGDERAHAHQEEQGRDQRAQGTQATAQLPGLLGGSGKVALVAGVEWKMLLKKECNVVEM